MEFFRSKKRRIPKVPFTLMPLKLLWIGITVVFLPERVLFTDEAIIWFIMLSRFSTKLKWKFKNTHQYFKDLRLFVNLQRTHALYPLNPVIDHADVWETIDRKFINRINRTKLNKFFLSFYCVLWNQKYEIAVIKLPVKK